MVRQKNIKVVYFAYINRDSHWKEIISGQLNQLKGYGMLDELEIYVHITDVAGIFEDVIQIIKNIVENAVISRSSDNHFEYHGIKLAYELAQQDHNAIIIYLHTKGISYNIKARKLEEIALLTGTFSNWRKKLEAFNDAKINKIGLFPAREKENGITIGGWIWYNFWYARASYLINCEKPKITTNRYQFEGWLAGKQQHEFVSDDDCYNLYNEGHKQYFTGPEADKEISFLVKMLQESGTTATNFNGYSALET